MALPHHRRRLGMRLPLLQLVLESTFNIALQGNHLGHLPTQSALVLSIFGHRLPSSFRAVSYAGMFLSTAKQDATFPALGHLTKRYSPKCVEGVFCEVHLQDPG
jgi:hypothetical protein